MSMRGVIELRFYAISMFGVLRSKTVQHFVPSLSRTAVVGLRPVCAGCECAEGPAKDRDDINRKENGRFSGGRGSAEMTGRKASEKPLQKTVQGCRALCV